MTKAEKEEALDARWEAIQKILRDEMIPFLDKKVDQIVNDLEGNIKIAVNHARSESRRCRKSASR